MGRNCTIQGLHCIEIDVGVQHRHGSTGLERAEMTVPTESDYRIPTLVHWYVCMLHMGAGADTVSNLGHPIFQIRKSIEVASGPTAPPKTVRQFKL